FFLLGRLQTRSLQLDLAVCQLDAARLRSVMTDIAAALAGRALSGQLFGAQHQDRFQRLHLDFVQHGLHHLAGAFDQIHDGKQDLPVALAELLDDDSRFLFGPGHNMVRFLHGGWLLFLSLVWQPDSIETGATAALPTFNYLWGTIYLRAQMYCPVHPKSVEQSG